MASLFDVGYHGTNADLDELLKRGYRFGKKSGNSLPFQWGGKKAYVTPNANLASTYGKNKLPVITAGGARSFPGGSVGSKGFTFGKEIPLTQTQFNKGAALANKLQSGAYPNSTMANAARTSMSNVPIKQSLIQKSIPTLMNVGSKLARFNPLISILQGLSPKALGGGIDMIDSSQAQSNIFEDYTQGNINVEDYSVTQQRVQAERAAQAQAQAAAKQQQILADQTRMQQGQVTQGGLGPNGGRAQAPQAPLAPQVTARGSGPNHGRVPPAAPVLPTPVSSTPVRSVSPGGGNSRRTYSKPAATAPSVSRPRARATRGRSAPIVRQSRNGPPQNRFR